MEVKKRAKIITEWIDNYCDTASLNPKALIVGISGGIDSSVIKRLMVLELKEEWFFNKVLCLNGLQWLKM